MKPDTSPQVNQFCLNPRVRDTALLETTGVDMTGPLLLRDGRKVWVCLYTCAVYRAVHLELALLLSTDSFIQTFQRFVARCGGPVLVYSDNGTNFVGLDNAFTHLEWKQISKHCAIEGIEWRFNPPTAAWWGGWWEQLIRLLKQLLCKTLRKASLTYKELEMVLCDCESVISSRPLTYVSEDATDLAPITPNMFLLDVKGVGLADCKGSPRPARNIRSGGDDDNFAQVSRGLRQRDSRG